VVAVWEVDDQAPYVWHGRFFSRSMSLFVSANLLSILKNIAGIQTTLDDAGPVLHRSLTA
jgi:hypothetical protein